MKVIVTGGAGFIGSHVVDACLREGHDVLVLDNLSTGRLENLEHVKSQIAFEQVDLGKNGGWSDLFRGCDWVIHLAALADIVPSIKNPEHYFHSNVSATLNVLEAARANSVKRFVYSASSSCYGIADTYPTPETSRISVEYPYALTKRLGEELVLHWAKVYGLPAVSLRFFNVYGTRSRTSGTYGAVFGVFLAQKLAKKPLTVVGDGTQTRDFTYVSDVADAVLAACKSDVNGEVFNVGSGKSVSVNAITELLGGDVVYIPSRPGEPKVTFADITKINQMIGWSPKISIQEGVAKINANIDYWKDAVVWTPQTISDATADWFKYLSK